MEKSRTQGNRKQQPSLVYREHIPNVMKISLLAGLNCFVSTKYPKGNVVNDTDIQLVYTSKTFCLTHCGFHALLGKVGYLIPLLSLLQPEQYH